MNEYWLADSEARVLGPVGLEVLRDLAVNGKLGEVRAVSKDGRAFAPVTHFPEVLEALGARTGDQQRIAVQRLRAFLQEFESKPFFEILRVPSNAPHAAYRSSFFALIRRYSPDRLPTDATIELRRACEDAFLKLAERMVEYERSRNSIAPPPPSAPSHSASPQVPAQRADFGVEFQWRGKTLEVKLRVQARDVSLFTNHPQANFAAGEVFLPTEHRIDVGTQVELSVRFEGHPTSLALRGRVSRPWQAAGELPAGIGVRFEGLSEADRAFVRAYLARAGRSR